MIDIGLSKLAVIGVTTLIVLGPERLPRVARLAGTLYGRAQRYLHDVKSEVARQIELEELRALHKEVQDSAHSIQAEVERFGAEVENLGAEVGNTLASDLGADAAPPPSGGAASAPASAAPRDGIAYKARAFRSKKLAKTASVPAWYKNRHGTRQRVLSGAAHARRRHPGPGLRTSFF